jgi:hypothetical protein
MKAQTKLSLIKIIHTLVWVIFVAMIGFVLWSGITQNVTTYSWLAAIAVLGEGAVLLIFKGHCPLTLMARRYSSSTRENFDIYLPNWLATHNKLIFSILFCIGLALMLRSCIV